MLIMKINMNEEDNNTQDEMVSSYSSANFIAGNSNSPLKKAKAAKEDEFYTQLTDIEKELRFYTEHFRDKVVFCNCDDPETSNFWVFFREKFSDLGLKKLVSTHYEEGKQSYMMELVGARYDDGELKYDNFVKTPLKGDGDFRSKECIEILKEADIVVTNPPFSLFRDYVSLLIEYKKKFLIIGNQNALTYKDIFRLIKENTMWLGNHNGDMSFRVPDYFKPRATRYWEDETGQKWRSLGNICWFTNLDHAKRHEEFLCYKRYSVEDYPAYVNYEAIDVSKAKDIPLDYDGVMGVPITFLDKFNPEQFEIVALGIVGSCEFSSNRKMEILKNGESTGRYTFNAKGTLYRKYNPSKDKKPPAFKDCETGELYSSIYARILIKVKR